MQTTPTDELAQLRARVEALEKERKHLVAVVEILQEFAGARHFTEIVQAVARRLGTTFGLDRCSIFLSSAPEDVRLVATFEDPSVSNLMVDLQRYPELKRAFDSGETVFIPDATSEPMLAPVQGELAARNVRSIVVVPIRWEQHVIGAIFLRTHRGEMPFTEADADFCRVVASLTATALHTAHQAAVRVRAESAQATLARQRDLERVALLAFLRRLLERHAHADAQVWAETLLPTASDEALDRVVGDTLRMLERESRR